MQNYFTSKEELLIVSDTLGGPEFGLKTILGDEISNGVSLVLHNLVKNLNFESDIQIFRHKFEGRDDENFMLSIDYPGIPFLFLNVNMTIGYDKVSHLIDYNKVDHIKISISSFNNILQDKTSYDTLRINAGFYFLRDIIGDVNRLKKFHKQNDVYRSGVTGEYKSTSQIKEIMEKEVVLILDNNNFYITPEFHIPGSILST